MWRDGPNGFCMWRSQQASCNGLPGRYIIPFFFFLKNIIFIINYKLLIFLQPAEVLGLVDIPSHIRFWGIDSGLRHRYIYLTLYES